MSDTITATVVENTETITATLVDNGETIVAHINELARGPAGSGGGGGSNAITSATTSDGTANLSISNVTTATAEVTGTLTAPHIHGNLAGNVYAHVRAGETLAKGDPVYVSGSHGSGSTLIAIVSKADASNAAKMPAVGIMDADVANNANGHMVITGTITELNTAAYAINAELYVASGGGFTSTPPSARAQPVARVERSNVSNGAILVKVNGLSAIDATASTLVRRDSSGNAAFAGLTVIGLIDAGDFTANGTTGDVVFGSASLITFDSISYTYGAGAAAAHRTALGLGNVDDTSDATKNSATATLTNKTINVVNNTLTGVARSGANTDITSITSSTALTLAAGGTNQNVNITPSGTGSVQIASGSFKTDIFGTTGGVGGFTDIGYPTAAGLRFGSGSTYSDGAGFQGFGGTHTTLPGNMYFDYGSTARVLANRKAIWRSLTTGPTYATVMQMEANGNVLIGTTTDPGTGKLHVAGNISTTGSITLGTALSVANGGTGSTTAAGARTNLAVPASDPTGITGAAALTNIVSLTQAQYDALGSKSSTTLYVIT